MRGPDVELRYWTDLIWKLSSEVNDEWSCKIAGLKEVGLKDINTSRVNER